MNTCGYCGQAGGDHAPDCLVRRSQEAEAKRLSPQPGVPFPNSGFDPELVIGPNGGPLWCITAATGRAVGDVRVTETFHVRAVTRDGAMLLAKEARLYMEDADAYQVSP